MLNENTLATIAARHGVSAFIGKERSSRSRPEEIATMLFSSVETVGAALGMGYLNGRLQTEGKDHWELFGLPVDLTVGVTGVIASVFGVFGPLDGHVASVSAGVAAAYFARLGLTKGVEARTKAANRLVAQATPGLLGSSNMAGGAVGNVVALDSRVQGVAIANAR